MSVEAFYGLPLQAGHAVAAAAGRTALWAISAYLKAPLRNTAIAALTALSAMAGANALYYQAGQHPAPLFGSFKSTPKYAKVDSAPVMPAQRPAQLLVQPEPETTGSVQTQAAVEIASTPIGNEDVFEIQRKLTAFKLFDGKVDGLYGPRTARAIKAFETSVGLTPKGELTPEIIERIKSTPITAEPVKVADPAAQPVASREVQPLALTETSSEPLPAPQPLVPEAETVAPVVEEAAVRVETGTGVTRLEMNSPPAAAANAPSKRTVQTIAVKAPEPTTSAAAASPVQSAPIDVLKSGTDPKVVGAIQRGLSSLGFLHGEIDGVAGEATAKAIRNFEVYYNYNVTGRITPELINLLVQNGAVI